MAIASARRGDRDKSAAAGQRVLASNPQVPRVHADARRSVRCELWASSECEPRAVQDLGAGRLQNGMQRGVATSLGS